MKWVKGYLAGIMTALLLCGMVMTANAKTAKVMQELTYRDIRVSLDGQVLDLRNAIGEKVEPFMFDGTNYLPVRALAEALGLNVAWDGKEVMVVLTTPTPAKEVRNLTAEELKTWSDFLSQRDCYGFLLSEYSTPLQADLEQVFYTGAGVGESPVDEALDEYLKAEDLEEAYTDVTFIPYDAANQVLERRTGHTLEQFKLAGNDIPMYYSETYKGYVHMAGDTNQILVECVSGQENPDGSIFLKSREKSWWGETDGNSDSVSTFETTLKPQNGNMIFDKNVVTGGWALSMLEWAREESGTQ